MAIAFSSRTQNLPSARLYRLRALAMVLVLCAGISVGLVATAAPAAAALPQRTAFENTIAWAVKRLVNLERALHGLRPVYMDDSLRLSARRHNVAMADYDEMSHQLPNEPWFGRREQLAGYWWNWAGENIGWNSDISTSGALLLQRLMYNEKPPNDGHRLNILNSHYHNIGVDVFFDHVHHKMWLTTDFGHRT
jgi:uncharacterized protein YkwD